MRAQDASIPNVANLQGHAPCSSTSQVKRRRNSFLPRIIRSTIQPCLSADVGCGQRSTLLVSKTTSELLERIYDAWARIDQTYAPLKYYAIEVRIRCRDVYRLNENHGP